MNASRPAPDGEARFGPVRRRVWSLMRAAVLLICAAGCLRTRRHTQFLIPDGYVGWVDVSYGVPHAPTLPDESGYSIVRLPSSGKTQTSTEIEGGRTGDQFFYVQGDQRKRLQPSQPGGGGLIWGDSVTGKSRGATREFFVGPEKAFRKTHPP
jgi:hypothetical protein